MAQPRETQLRLLYSLLKPVVRIAARFHVPMRSLTELLRLAYFESLRNEGLPAAAIAHRLGQTERHMRSLARRLRGDFFAAEYDVGLVREIEDLVATSRLAEADLASRVHGGDARDVAAAVAVLIDEGRVVRAIDGLLAIAPKYVVLSSDTFQHRIDALNHFLDGLTRAVLERLVFDQRHEAMIKTVTFSAKPARLVETVARLEGDIRRDVARLEEEASFDGHGRRYTLGLTLAPLSEQEECDGGARGP